MMHTGESRKEKRRFPFGTLSSIEFRIVGLAALVGLLIGVFDAAVDYILFYHGSFLEILITDIPEEELWKRAVALVVCLSFGVVLARVMHHRFRAEKARAESEHQFHLLFESAPDAICMLTLRRRIIDANQAAALLTGYERQDLIGRRFPEDGLILSDQLAGSRDLLARITHARPTGPDEIALTDRRGNHVIAELRTYPVRLSEQTIIMCIIRDVTDQKRTEREKALLEEQLRQAQKMESIGRLAGGIAHDFNNLLTSIIGHAELGMMQQKSRGAQVVELQEIISSGQRAAQLTRQLLTFSRKQVVTPEVLNMNEVVVRLGRMLHRLISEDVRIENRLDPALENVRADPTQMEQMLMNLAVNARDAMPLGGQLTIETANVIIDEAYVRMHPDLQAGSYVMLSISDTGHGMSAEVQGHVFEPFFTTKEVGKGTGLGLSTVYGIVKQHNGSIDVTSREGAGTTFRIFLPAVNAPLETAAPASMSVEARGGAETILLVEDQETVRRLLQRTLADWGYHVIAAQDGQAALSVARDTSESIDLLITDVIMPGMNGKELYERLSGMWPHLKVIYMSGYTDDVVLHQGMLDAGTVFLQKPIPLARLARKVRDVLDSAVRS